MTITDYHETYLAGTRLECTYTPQNKSTNFPE